MVEGGHCFAEHLYNVVNSVRIGLPVNFSNFEQLREIEDVFSGYLLIDLVQI